MVFDVVAKRLGMHVHSLRFIYDGSRVTPKMTARSLEMECGDEIDAMVEQTG